ncbi:unnamed protein product [Ceutorhynchus assimilis]|uniref:Uncharacterized protein n=1 Tax=Ceutorhynchus assimilis TaxID=467358 RepID=A0A9N9MT28_9CUCU|nr:unnamed protein product [Ceutorhynchus assimilis]
MSKLKQKVENIKPEEVISSKCNILPTIEELSEREKRASNILIFGLEESQTSSEDEAGTDVEKANSVINSIDRSVPTASTKVFRLGKAEPEFLEVQEEISISLSERHHLQAEKVLIDTG